MKFQIFNQFPEVKIQIFNKEDDCKSDEEAAHRLGFEDIAKLEQIHGNVVHTVHKQPDTILKGDSLITNVADLALAIRFADCQAFAVYAPKKHAVGLIHAGWRGIAAKAITSFFEELKNKFEISQEETFVGGAPSICSKCATFSDPEKELPTHMHEFIKESGVDLVAAAQKELHAVGVPKDHIEILPGCTKCGDGYFSARGGDNDRRNYLVAGITKPSRHP
jgi:polyphenol oxidase